MIEPTQNLGLISRVDAHVESALIRCECGTVEVGRCSLRCEGGQFYFDALPPARTMSEVARMAAPVAPRRLGWLLRLDAWCESIPAAQLRAFDRIATLAGKWVLTGAAVYLMIEIANAWIAGRFRFGGN